MIFVYLKEYTLYALGGLVVVALVVDAPLLGLLSIVGLINFLVWLNRAGPRIGEGKIVLDAQVIPGFLALSVLFNCSQSGMKGWWVTVVFILVWGVAGSIIEKDRKNKSRPVSISPRCASTYSPPTLP